jgi:DNA repair protein RecO (recombination protein O)
MLKIFNGIIIKSDEFSDSDRILTVFSKEEGKIPILYKRAKQIKKASNAVSQLFSVSEFVCYKGSNFYIHNSSMLLKSYMNIPNALHRLAIASYYAQMINYSYENYQKDERAYNLLIYCMNKTDKFDNDQCIKYIALFQAKLLAILGYAPVLDCCVVCKKQSNLCSFDIELGGTICSNCVRELHKYQYLSEQDIKILTYLINIPLNKENLEKIDLNNIKNLIELLHYCLNDKMESHITTYDFLMQALQ